MEPMRWLSFICLLNVFDLFFALLTLAASSLNKSLKCFLTFSLSEFANKTREKFQKMLIRLIKTL